MESDTRSKPVLDTEKSQALPSQDEISGSPSLASSSSKSSIRDEKEVSRKDNELDSRLLVSWDGDDDPKNPYNWSITLKWSLTVLVSLGSFVTMMSGSMIAPALTTISHDVHVSESAAELVLSIFILAFAFGPLVIAPFSEMYGRRPIWLICGTFYSIWNIECGFSHNKGMLIAGRLLSGLGASADFVLAWPVVCDIWRPEHRGKSFMVSGMVPILGPALGPLVGGIIADKIGWRWIFWWAAIFNGVLIILALFIFPETSSKQILGQKAAQLRKSTGEHYHTEYEGPYDTMLDKFKVNLSRPIKLLFTSPILLLASILWAYSFGILYFFLSTFAQLFTSVYHQTVLQSGLHYIAIAIGYILADQVGAILMDKLWEKLTKKHGDDPVPEYRIPLLIPGGVLVPIGLLWYGWSAQAKLHWIMPDIGAAIFGCGFMLICNAVGAYILDCFDKYTASAMAASQVLRMIAGFAFPIFAPAMYSRLGWGWANTVLALIAFVFGLPAPWILWTYGARIRAIGKPNW